MVPALATEKSWNAKRFVALATVGYTIASLAFLAFLYGVAPTVF